MAESIEKFVRKLSKKTEIAKKTISAIKKSGADCVKLQTYTPDTLTIDDINKDNDIIDETSLNDYKYLLPVDLDQKEDTSSRGKSNVDSRGENNTFLLNQLVKVNNMISNGYKITPDKNNKACDTECNHDDIEKLNSTYWYKIRQCLGYTPAPTKGQEGVWTTQNPLNDGMRSKCNSMNPNNCLLYTSDAADE